jgi:splicing factor 3A subunit 1
MVVQGIIRPPPEIRAVADKTASFVAKNGRGFETRIMNSAKGKTPKFAFLHESSPFHAYYEDRILFYTNGGVDEEKKEEGVTDTKQPDKGAGEGAVVKKEQDQTESGAVAGGKEKLMARKAKSIVDPVARALLAQRSRIQRILDSESESESNEEQSSSEPNDGSTANTEKESLIPPQQRYTVLLAPNNISLAQLEVIKLTAQFAALNGKGGSFLRDLTIREWNNPFWGFLQPRHSHYAYFTQLIELYRRLLQEAVVIHEIEMKQRSNEMLGDQISLLELAKIKDSVGLDASLEEKEDIKNQINLIESTAGNVYKCLEYSAYHAEYDRYYEEKRRTELESMEGSGGLGGTAKIDWHDFVVVETIDFHVDEIVESLPPPPPPVSLKSDQVQTKEADTEMEESSDEDDEQIKVVEGYAPKVVSSQAKLSSESMTHVIDPITKKSIPIADMTEHMRIQLLDPKWAAEKAKFLEKQKESNLVSGDEIARNMMTFAKGRTDLFGTAVSAIKMTFLLLNPSRMLYINCID